MVFTVLAQGDLESMMFHLPQSSKYLLLKIFLGNIQLWILVFLLEILPSHFTFESPVTHRIPSLEGVELSRQFNTEGHWGKNCRKRRQWKDDSSKCQNMWKHILLSIYVHGCQMVKWFLSNTEVVARSAGHLPMNST